ncbi:VWA domain-containing protein [Thiomicrospira microaerophila]|uniref:vWA domain-containing protein n=1 Tax=Thiomicrospira microaerophila TaxID=406020 RepID=UPI00200EC466|nr:VWA domain-containing protein [Thiomicrospira microaerophila]UQB42235.1 VWA domain-containing protein [Thiomicrospira microaerophila]
MSPWFDWQFAQPAWFWLLLLWPLLQLLTQPWRAKTQASDSANVFFHPRIAAFFKSQTGRAAQPQAAFSRLGYGVSFVLKTLILISLLAALANPQRQIEQAPNISSQPVRDIALVVESSVSFILEDYQLDGQAASRMEVVKSVLDQFIGGLAHNRFSIAVYAEQAYTLVPMTADAHAVRANLQRLQPYLAGRTDPAMGEALGLALREVANQQSEIEKRILVLVSDGLQSQSRIELSAIVDYAESLDVPIYTIGIGAGSLEADQRRYSGLIYQPIETASLQFLAQHTGGQFYQVGGAEDLSRVLAAIEQHEGVETQDMSQARWREESLAVYPLGLALGLFALWWLLSLGGQRWNF